MPLFYRRQLRCYLLYKLLLSTNLLVPIWVLYLRELGLTYTAIQTLEVVFWGAIALSSLPAGVLSDFLGRKMSLLTSSFLLTLATLLFGLARGYELLIPSYIFWGMGIALQGSSDSAFLYDTLVAAGRAHEYRRLAGLLGACSTAAFGLSSLLGGIVADALGSRSSILLSVLPLLFSLFPGLAFQEPAPRGKRTSYGEHFRASLALAWRHPRFKRIAFYGTAIAVAGSVSAFFLQPRLQEAGLPLRYFGMVYLGVSLSGALGSELAHRGARALGLRRTFNLLPLGLMGTIMLIAYLPAAAGAALFLPLSFVGAFAGPVLSDAINRQMPGTHRATLLALQQLLFTVVHAPAGVLAGVVSDSYGMEAALVINAIWLALAMSVLHYLGRRRERAASAG